MTGDRRPASGRARAAYSSVAVPSQATKRPGTDSARATSRNGRTSMRVAAAQPRNRTIDFRLNPSEVLARVDRSLVELEQLVHRAGAAGCDALATLNAVYDILKKNG